MSTLPCQVWLTNLASKTEEHDRLLNDVEQARRNRYLLPEGRARFTMGAALLRRVVAHELGVDPRAVAVDRACLMCGAQHGKARLPNSDLHISLSHSGDLIALAVTRVAPIGIDIELITQRDTDVLVKSVLAAGETLRRASDFYVYWCRKEATVKATGDGMRVALAEVVVSRPDEPARLISYQKSPMVCSMRDLALAPGYAAALAMLADGDLEVDVRDARALFEFNPN